MSETEHKKIDDFFDCADKWKEEMQLLRKILHTTTLEEKYKWRQPCYTFNNKNICIIGSYKSYCVLSFFKGSLLKDEHNILEKPGPNTRSGRIVKFTDTNKIAKLEPILLQYISDAIQLEKAGKEVDFSKNRKITYPKELKETLENDAAFNMAFENLTPGRKRGYLLHFAAAKNAKTVLNRIEKYKGKIMQGKGMNDWK